MTSDSRSEADSSIPTLRDLVVPIFRHRRAGTLMAAVVFCGASLVVLARPDTYEAQMKILVKRERVEPFVSADRDLRPQARTDVTEEELNSEVELLRSRDLLEQVVVAAGLHTGAPQSAVWSNSLPRVVQRLQSHLTVDPIRGSTLIRVIYRSSNPVQAARVLGELARLYPEKHLALHRPAGAYQFFSDQAERFRQELSVAQERLVNFGRQEHVVSADLEKQNTLQRLADFEAALEQALSSIADTTRRIAQLDQETALTPTRQTTQIRTSERGELIDQLKSSILGLEVKHAEMLRKFAPTYPPAVEIEQELNQSRAALARAEQSPSIEEITDQNPTHQWLRSELARVKTERAASLARAAALRTSVATYRNKARLLEEKTVGQQTLIRAVKSAEENYLLYRRKQEEARISDALDRTRIVNVAIAEAPTVPALPSNTATRWLLALAVLAAAIIGTCTTYVLDYLSPYLRTPDEVERALDIPVLATLPARR
jgi:uncharacterized protein involved in exopolysaccharide biosynthesis